MSGYDSDLCWLDGPGFAAWLEENTDLVPERGSCLEKSIQLWRDGAKPSVFTADDLLTPLGRHLSELPDELYVDPPPIGRATPPAVKEEALEALRGGERPASVASRLGVTKVSVYRWRAALVV